VIVVIALLILTFGITGEREAKPIRLKANSAFTVGPTNPVTENPQLLQYQVIVNGKPFEDAYVTFELSNTEGGAVLSTNSDKVNTFTDANGIARVQIRAVDNSGDTLTVKLILDEDVLWKNNPAGKVLIGTIAVDDDPIYLDTKVLPVLARPATTEGE